MVCPSATSETEARWPIFGLVVVATTSRRDNKDQMIRPICLPATSEAGARWPRFDLVVVATTRRRDNKDQMIRPIGTGCAMDYVGKYTVDVFSI
jgi:hypothetical protein